MNLLTNYIGYTPNRIAVFRALKLGDLLCSVPAFRSLRQAFPKAHIALISLPWASEFVACYPQYFDEFIAFPGWPGLPEQPLNPTQTVAFLEQMQTRSWDVVLQLQGNGTLVNAMLSLFDAKALAGYYLPDQRAEQWVASTGLFQPYPMVSHEVRRHVGLMKFLGLPPKGHELEFTVTEADLQVGRELLNRVGVSREPYVCFHAGGISGRRWPASRFAEVADALARRGYTIVLTGTTGEQPIIDTVRSAMTYPAVSIAGQTSLRSLGAVLQGAALLISNDTGVSHLAVACKTPSVVVFTSADPAEWAPLDQSRHRVVREEVPETVRQVITEATNLLASGLCSATDDLANAERNLAFIPTP